METMHIQLRILNNRTPHRIFNGIDLFCGYPVEFYRPSQDFHLVLEVPNRIRGSHV